MADKTSKTNTTTTMASPVTGPEVAIAADKTGKTKPKRFSKSDRTHQRRLKQATRKPGGGS
jgi:hypothetical protein